MSSQQVSCYHVGARYSTGVTLDAPFADVNVGTLKVAIATQLAYLNIRDPHQDLDIFNVPILDGDHLELEERAKAAIAELEPLPNTWSLSGLTWSDPTEEKLDIIVQVSNTGIRPSLNLSELLDLSFQENKSVLEKWKRQTLAPLPRLDHLAAYLDAPIPDDLKIPIHKKSWLSLLEATTTTDPCDEEDVGSLFRSQECFPNTYHPFTHIYFAVADSPSPGGTEATYISFWDANIRRVLEMLNPKGRSSRDSNRQTETKGLRPEYAFILEGSCVFRGEETAPDCRGFCDSARAELTEKMAVWPYDDAPYVLGYYNRGTEVTLVALFPKPDTFGTQSTRQKRTLDQSQGLSPKRVVLALDLATADLGTRRGRIQNIRMLFKVSTLLRSLRDHIQFHGNEFTPMTRDSCTIEITNKVVLKTFTGPDATDSVHHLRHIYNLLSHHNVPHTDQLLVAHRRSVHLYPPGRITGYITEIDLFQCLRCVLEALIVLHTIPMYHRDIRWDNIINSYDDPDVWLIIDWGEASTVPTKAAPNFSKHNHCKSVFEDGHGAEVDIWAVGHLIEQWQSRAPWNRQLMELGVRLKAEPTKFTAEQVLELVMDIRASIPVPQIVLQIE